MKKVSSVVKPPTDKELIQVLLDTILVQHYKNTKLNQALLREFMAKGRKARVIELCKKFIDEEMKIDYKP